jgi:nitroreductase
MIELLRKRRSIRKYTKETVAKESLDILTEALLRSPSSQNNQPWEFIIVNEPELLSKLSQAKEHGSSFLKNAPLGIVVCADSAKSDVWIEDCSVASILVQMSAQSLGLRSCWIQVRNRAHDKNTTSEEYIRGVLGIPENIMVESIISIGHPDEIRDPVPKDKLDYRKIRYNRF